MRSRQRYAFYSGNLDFGNVPITDASAQASVPVLSYFHSLNFFGRTASAAVFLQLSLDVDDRMLAERIAHTVKGVAGNLGISGVQSAARKHLNALSQTINNFEFEQALVRLNEIAELCQRIGQ